MKDASHTKAELLDFVRRKAITGMSSNQIAADYANDWHTTYDFAKQRMKEPQYQEAIEAGRQTGLGQIWEKLHDLAISKNDQGILLLLAKEQLKLFGGLDTQDLLAKSNLTKDQLKKVHEVILGK
jgi:hypothetical protein